MSKTRNYQRFDTIRQVFMLDIDETLFVIEVKDSSTGSDRITPGAHAYINEEKEKPIRGDATTGIQLTDTVYVHSATPLMSRHWKGFFDKIIRINDQYRAQTGDPRPLITCKFLTDAMYKREKFIENVFDKVYDVELRKKLFPDASAYYFNRNDRKASGRNDKSDYVNDYLFPRILVPEGITKKKNVTLIDNSPEHYGGMISKGFSAVYVQTTEPLVNSKGLADLTARLFEDLHSQLDSLASKAAIIQAESEVAKFWTSGDFSKIINTQGIDQVIRHVLADTEFWHQQMFIPGSDIDNIPEGIQRMRAVALLPEAKAMTRCANEALQKKPCCNFFSKPITRSNATQAFYKLFETKEDEEKGEVKREAGADSRKENLAQWLRTHYVTPQARAQKRMVELHHQKGVRSISMSYSH